MSGLLALLDDVATIAKVAAASVDDVVSQAAKAGAKTAGVIIDDAAVTPKYLHGFDASRELPIVWRIAKGSIWNKLVILLPVGMLLSRFAPWAITPLLMLGGCYLCFEGAEKVAHVLMPHQKHTEAAKVIGNPVRLEEKRVTGAIKTDLILSAEIMTIALSTIPGDNFWFQAATLAVVGVGITVAVYGGVALIVKADDVGLFMHERGRLGVTRGLGRAIVRGMPRFLVLLTVVGTAAMLWVGGSIVIHGMEVLGFDTLGHWIHDAAEALGARLGAAGGGAVTWLTKASLDGVFGLLLGLLLIPLVARVLSPAWKAVTGKRPEAPASRK